MQSARFEVAVIGAGASGTLVAVHWRRLAGAGARLALVEAGARAARGLAYGTPYGAHLLNVPAGKMSGLPDDPDHFLRWLRGRMPEAVGATFAPRPLFGDYLADLLGEHPLDAPEVRRIAASAVGLMREGADWRIHLRDGRTLLAGAVVLALGNLPPADPLRLGADAPHGYHADPWAPGVLLGLPTDAPVLFIGSGLTAVDLMLALRDAGHRGPLHALSRHGRLPAAHAPHQPRAIDPPSAARATPARMVRWLRDALANGEGADWRAVIDGLRPHTQAIWRGWDPAARRQFLRHARSLWEIHRHRMAPEIAVKIEALRASGVLKNHAGTLRSLAVTPGGLRACWTSPEDGCEHALDASRVINCTGPASDYARVELPLVAHLRDAGWLTPDPLGMGVTAGPDGRLIGASGTATPGLYTLGPLRRGDLWESTAIPEIRSQAAELAERLAAGER